MKSVYQHIRSKSSTGGLHDLLELLVEDAMKSFKLASLAELGYTFDWYGSKSKSREVFQKVGSVQKYTPTEEKFSYVLMTWDGYFMLTISFGPIKLCGFHQLCTANLMSATFENWEALLSL